LERDQQGNNTNFFLLIIFLFSTSSSNWQVCVDFCYWYRV
jgi:hypothetical protein